MTWEVSMKSMRVQIKCLAFPVCRWSGHPSIKCLYKPVFDLFLPRQADLVELHSLQTSEVDPTYRSWQTVWTGELLLLLCWIFLPWMVDFLFNHWVILVIVWYTKHLSWKRCWGKGTLAYSILIWPLDWIDLLTKMTFGPKQHLDQNDF